MRSAASGAWEAIANDITANIMTYLGVLLAIVVIFAFFAFGYFGDVISIKNLRPVVELAVPLTFFGLAAVLRKRGGASLAATAVALIGALTVPVMLSASFRDGSLCCPPDLNGSSRWVGYAAAGLISAAVYIWMAKRETVYAYLVGPAVWASVGALGLYATFGVSGYQLFLVTVAMGASLYGASLLRETRWGTILAIPIARMATLGGPFVFVVAVIFAYGDLSRAGDIVFEDVSAPSAFAAWAAVALLAGASTSSFAWSGLPDKVRNATMLGLRASAYVMAAMAVVVTMGLGISMVWAGPLIVGYGLFVYALDRKFGGAGNVPLFVARAAIVGGSVISLVDPLVGFWTWTGLALGAGVYLVHTRFSEFFSALLPHSSDAPVREWTAWVTLVVAGTFGAFSVADGFDGVVILFGAAILAGLSRMAGGKLAPLGTYATVPATALAWLALMRLLSLSQGVTDSEMALALALLASAAAVVKLPWVVRAPVVAAGSVGALSLLAGQWAPVTSDVAGAVAAVSVGGLYILASLRTSWRSHAITNGIVGNLALYLAIGTMGDPDARLIALTGLVILNALQGAAVERGACPLVSVLARQTQRWRPIVRALPSGIAALALLPLSLNVASLSTLDDRVTATVMLGALAWGYAVSISLRIIRSRAFGVGLSYTTLGLAILVSLPVSWLATFAALSGALVATLIAATLRRPNWTLPAWMLATLVVGFAAFSMGSSASDINNWVFGWIALVLVGVSVANGRPTNGGISSSWLRPPAALAMVMLPSTTVIALAGDSGVAILATLAAAVFALFGYRTRAAGMSVPVGVFVALAYAQAIDPVVSLIDDPVGWVPLIIAFAAVAVVLPGRGSWHVLDHPSPGILGATYAIGAFALVSSPGTGWLPSMLLTWVALMLVTHVVFGVLWARYAALAVLVAAGATAGDGWVGGSLVIVAVVLGFLSTEFDGVVASLHRWGTTVAAFAGVVFLGVWQQWTPETTVLLGLVSGALLTITAMFLERGAVEHPGRRGWWIPLGASGQTSLLVAVAVVLAQMEPVDVPGVLFVVFALDGLVSATYAVIRTDRRLAGIASVFFALAYGSFVLWVPLSDDAAITSLLVGGVIAAVGGAVIPLSSRGAKLGMWWPGLTVVGHTAMWASVGLQGINGGDWVLMIAIVLSVDSILAGVYAQRRAMTEAALLSVLTGVAAVVAFGEVLGLTQEEIFVVAFGAGLVLAGIGTVASILRGRERTALWWRPMALVGHATAFLVVALAFDLWVFEDALGLLSALAAFEAIVFGLYAVDTERHELAWASAGLFGVGVVSSVLAFDVTRTQFATTSVAVGSITLLLWTYLMSRADLSPKLKVWLWPGLIVSEIALSVGAAILFDVASKPAGSLAVAAVLAVNAAAIGVVATGTRIQALFVTAISFLAASYGFALYAFEPSPTTAMVGLWIATAVFGTVATWLGGREHDLAPMWAKALLVVTPVGLISIIAEAGAAGEDTRLVGVALSSVTAAAILWLNNSMLDLALSPGDPEHGESRTFASGLLVFGMGSLALWYPSEPWVIAPILLTAAAGIGAAHVWSTDENNHAALISWVGLAAVAQVGAVSAFDALSTQSSGVLALSSVGLVAVGVLGVRHRFVMAGIVGLTTGLAGVVNNTFDLAAHAAIVLVAVAVLTVLESERLLRKSEGRTCPDIFRIVEWVAMAAPMIIAAIEMLNDLNFGILLVLEGVVLSVWGFGSRIKRRVLCGLSGIVVAITIGVVLPVLSGVREGFGSGGWLIVGAVMAVVLIATGSNISRHRASFGKRLDRLGSMMEDWE